MDIILLQFFLGIILFFLINMIGRHSYSIGYMEISLFVKTEEAPAFNFIFRVLTPVVYLIIISTILYYLGADKFVKNIYLVNVYYISFRLFFNLVTNRGLLLNWGRQFLYWISIVVISYFVYDKIIKEKTNILPDFTTISNELWIIILIFIFQIANNIRTSQNGTIKRKDDYLKKRYYNFKKKYGQIIKDNTKNEVLESIAYAILIYEDFNRPKIARYIERLVFKVKNKPHTLGVMQVNTAKNISDLESVNLGTNKIYQAWLFSLEKHKLTQPNSYLDWSIKDEIIADYNGSSSYLSEVSVLANKIQETFYKSTSDKLLVNLNPI
jgi:hypothetical protein